MVNTISDFPFGMKIVEGLKDVGGILGIVLGGSRARGTHTPDSDFDIGVYYSAAEYLDIDKFNAAAAKLDDTHSDGLIVPPGEWGKWVNGGGWLTIDGEKVDIILRDADRVEQSIMDCLTGNVHAHYQTGHPHAYINSMYAGELSIAKILYDPTRRLIALQEKTKPYPEALRQAICRAFGFEAGFSLMLACTNADKNDPYYVIAHLIRSVSCLNQVLFALNSDYCINEKRAVSIINGFSIKPERYEERIAIVMKNAGKNEHLACQELETIISDTCAFYEK